MKRAVIYARLSDVRKGETDGIERQVREAEAHAERLGVEIVERLVDNDLSAAKRKCRPAFERLMEGIAGNEWEVVVLRSLDRWVRRPAELERIIEVVEKSKVKVEAIHGEIDLRTRQGRLNARLVTAVAMNEVEATTERVTDWHKDRAARGLALHSQPGYGFHRAIGSPDVTVVAEEAERIRDAAARVLAGVPLKTIVREWNAQEVPAPGERWQSSTLRRILLAPRTAGLRVHRGEVVGDAVWPAILEREQWEQLGRLLRNPSRRTALSRDARLLTGIASCGKCEQGLNHKMMGNARRYFCRHCFGTTVYAEHLENHVVASLCAFLDEPSLTDRLRGRDDTDTVAAEILTIEADLDSLAEEVAHGRLTLGEWKIMQAGMRARLEPLRARLARAQPEAEWVGRGVELAGLWDTQPPAQQRRTLTAWVEDVRVNRAIPGVNRFDERRVKVTFRA